MTEVSKAAAGPVKKFVQFQPSALRSPQECDRYYAEVHTVWAMRALRDSASLVGYETNRVELQWDLLGGFEHPPDQWRFAVLRETGESPLFTAAQARILACDHPNFLRDLRRFDVEEAHVLERPSRSLSSVKYLLVLDRDESLTDGQESAAVASLVTKLRALLESAHGARRMVANRVLREHESAPGAEPGQLPTNRVVETDRVSFIELWFDDRVWGQEFFASAQVREAAAAAGFAPGCLRGYRVAERVSLDRRPTA